MSPVRETRGEVLRWGYSMSRAMRRWATLNGCRRVEPTVWIDRGRHRQRYAACGVGGAVEAVIDVDGEHSWRVPDNDIMLRFLLSRRLPSSR